MLTPQETVEIFQVLRRLADEGTSIVFISHKLYEVLGIADRITVIRRGRVVGQADPKTATEEDLAEMMVGREVSLVVDKGPAHPGEVVLEVEDLRPSPTTAARSWSTARASRSGPARSSASPGVAGNGQDELVEALNGLRRSRSGMVEPARPGRDATIRRASCPNEASPTSRATGSVTGSSCPTRSRTTSS